MFPDADHLGPLKEELGYVDTELVPGLTRTLLSADRILPLSTDAGQTRTLFMSVFTTSDGEPRLISVELTLRGEGSDLLLVEADCDVRNVRPGVSEAAAERLEQAYLDTHLHKRVIRERPARPRKALWYGGGQGRNNAPHDWELRIQACFAVRGLDVLVSNSGDWKRAKDSVLRTEIDAAIVWQAAGVSEPASEAIVNALEKRTPSGLYVLNTWDFEDALTDTRAWLEALVDNWEPDDAAKPASAGDVRFYKKVGGGAGGDRYERRKGPCMHDTWQQLFKADKKEKAIGKMEGMSPRGLFWCPKCHTVQARF